MAWQTRYAGTVVDDASLGTIAWANPTNAQGAPNGTLATAGAPSSGPTHYLKATNYGFAIPADARIDGVVFTPTMSVTLGTGVGSLETQSPRIVLGGVINLHGRLSSQLLPTVLTAIDHGAPNDTWDVTLQPSTVNDSGFGMAIRIASIGGTVIENMDAMAITVYYTRPHEVLPVVVFRDADRPHGALFMEYADALLYGLRLRAPQTGSMLISRSAANAARIASLLQKGRMPMVTVEWPDGFTPFAGFITGFSATLSDSHYAFQFQDHCSKLSLARTKIAPARRMQAGPFMAEVLGEMEGRAAPPLQLNLSHLVGGPDVNRELRASQGDSFVRAVETDTDYDAFFNWAIAPGAVETWLELAQMQGVDRRTEDVWQEGRQIVDATVAYDYLKGAAEALAVGGTGAFGARPNVTQAHAPAIGGGGTLVTVQQTITDQQMLQQRADALLRAPSNAVRTGVSKVLETAIDRSAFGVGDIRVQRFESAFLGVPTEIVTRITAIAINPATGIHDCTWVEV